MKLFVVQPDNRCLGPIKRRTGWAEISRSPGRGDVVIAKALQDDGLGDIAGTVIGLYHDLTGDETVVTVWLDMYRQV